MIIRLGHFGPVDLSDRTWVPDALTDCPGFRGWYHVVDDATGDELSLTMWDDEAAAAAGEAAVAAAGRAVEFSGPGPVRVQRLRVASSR
jgi:heme-degrading monooxygenase HmoA